MQADASRGGWATPSPRRLYVAATAVALVIGAAVVVTVVAGGGGNRGSIAVAGRRLPTSSKYGHPPSWLKIPEPSSTAPVPRATPAHPQLAAMQGYPVDATLASGARARYSVVGPQVPGWVANDASSGNWRVGETAPATFEVTLQRVDGTVPLSPADFSVITYTGQLLHPHITTAGGGALPSRITSGHSLTLTMKTSLPEGDGELRWAPGGKRILVSYFWTLEFD